MVQQPIDLEERCDSLMAELATLQARAERAEGELTALRSQAGARGDWQPISTAPKDGTHFLAAWNDHDECHVVYIRNGECQREMDNDHWMMPTFWMALPAIPPARLGDIDPLTNPDVDGTPKIDIEDGA